MDFFTDNDDEVKRFTLENIKAKKSLHVTICISGWLSENADMKDDWKAVISNEFQALTYALRWDSSSYLEFAFYDFPLFLIYAIGKFSKKWYSKFFSKKFAESWPFSKRIGIAEHTGKKLADHISEGVMKNCCISLLGFSLGTRVMYACLTELKEKGYQVHDAYFLGGASPVSLDWANARKAASGRFVASYSKKDYANSLLYRLDQNEVPIGTDGIPKEVINVENFDVTHEAGLHITYRKNMVDVLEKIRFNSS